MLLRTFGFLVLLLGVPAASACSFAGPVPEGNGAFVIHDLASGAEDVVLVEEPGLDGDCSLGNAFAIQGRWFARVDGGALLLRDLETGEDTAFSYPDGHVKDLGLTYPWVARTTYSRTAEVLDLRTSTWATVGWPEGWHALGLTGTSAILRHEDNATDYALFDLATQAWSSPTIRHPEGSLHGPLASPGWLAFPFGDTPMAYRASDGVGVPIPDLGIPVALDNDTLWFRADNGRWVELRIGVGPAIEHGADELPLGDAKAVDGRRSVTGHFRYGVGSAPTPEDKDSPFVPMAGATLLLVAVAAIRRKP